MTLRAEIARLKKLIAVEAAKRPGDLDDFAVDHATKMLMPRLIAQIERMEVALRLVRQHGLRAMTEREIDAALKHMDEEQG